MQTEKRLYVDGLWLARHAAERLDASFNWVDVAALARRAGGGAPINACYFAIFDPQDPQSASPARALIQALESQGVTCVVREEPAPPQECTRCGHGWEHYPETLLGVDLALEADIRAAADKSARLWDLFASQVDVRLQGYGFELISPRDALARGSHISYAHPEGYRIMQALIARGVIGDFRDPDVLRFGLTPLYLGFEDVWRAVDILDDVVRDGAWRDEPGRMAGRVT